LAEQIVVAEASRYIRRTSFGQCGEPIMTIFKIAAWLYLIQAAIGFAAGFMIPWLQLFRVAGY